MQLNNYDLWKSVKLPSGGELEKKNHTNLFYFFFLHGVTS